MSVEDQVIIIYAVTNGYLKEIPVSSVLDFQSALFSYIHYSHPEIAESIVKTKDLTEENEKELIKALEDFVEKYKKESLS